MAQNIRDYFSQIGLNVDVDESVYQTSEGKRAKALEELKKHSFGTDKISGKETFMTENQAIHMYDNVYSKNSSNISKGQNAKAYMDNDFARSQGQYAGAGGQAGYTMGFRSYRMADRGEIAKSILPDTARSVGENFKNSLGLVTRQQREQFRSGGLAGKAGALLGPGLGAATIFSTIINGDDMYETMTFNMASAAGMAGFTAGSRIAGSMFKGAEVVTNPDTGIKSLKGGKMRFAAGAVGGAVGFTGFAAVVGGGMWAASDLTSNKSVLASVARGYSKLPANANTEQNNMTLTMRQKALQQLSQSAMNDRASLLGNEAAVLRGVL